MAYAAAATDPGARLETTSSLFSPECWDRDDSVIDSIPGCYTWPYGESADLFRNNILPSPAEQRQQPFGINNGVTPPFIGRWIDYADDSGDSGKKMTGFDVATPRWRKDAATWLALGDSSINSSQQRMDMTASTNTAIPSRYITEPRCNFSYRNMDDMKECVNHKNKTVLLFGDSLMRRISNMLVGQTTFREEKDRKMGSAFSMQNDASMYLTHDVHASDPLGSGGSHNSSWINYIPAWRFMSDPKDEQAVLYGNRRVEDVLKLVRSTGQQLDTLVYGIGYHDMYQPVENLRREFVTTVRMLKRYLYDEARREWKTKLLWLLPHKVVDHKIVTYAILHKRKINVDLYGNKRVHAFNYVMRRWLRAMRIPFYDAFELTIGKEDWTEDGTHYEPALFNIKSQMVMDLVCMSLEGYNEMLGLGLGFGGQGQGQEQQADDDQKKRAKFYSLYEQQVAADAKLASLPANDMSWRTNTVGRYLGMSEASENNTWSLSTFRSTFHPKCVLKGGPENLKPRPRPLKKRQAAATKNEVQSNNRSETNPTGAKTATAAASEASATTAAAADTVTTRSRPTWGRPVKQAAAVVEKFDVVVATATTNNDHQNISRPHSLHAHTQQLTDNVSGHHTSASSSSLAVRSPDPQRTFPTPSQTRIPSSRLPGLELVASIAIIHCLFALAVYKLYTILRRPR